MNPTTYQQPELRDANDQIIRSGTFGKNTALSNSTNDGWIDYVMNNLEYLYTSCLPLSGGTMTGDITPSSSSVNLGSPSYRWGNIYTQNLDIPSGANAAELFKTLQNSFSSSAPEHNTLYRGAEITDSWATIQSKIRASNFKDYYIGDYKSITLTTGETVICEIAGINTYTKSGPTAVGNHIDFISRDCLSGDRRVNASNNNNGTSAEKHPWCASELFGTLNDASTGVYSKLPSDLKAVIIEKRAYLEERYSSGGAVTADTGWSDANLGKLWLPSEIEVFGHPVWSEPGYGTAGYGVNVQYPIFRLNPSKIVKGKGNGGTRDNWWTLSADRLTSERFCLVYSSGFVGRTNASNYNCVPLCFRIG